MGKIAISFVGLGKKAIVLLLLLFSVQLIMADTDHNGIITADETWYAYEGNHFVLDSLVVASGVTLTIMEGCRVYFDDANSYMKVYGTLHASGVNADIKFGKAPGFAYISWKGLIFMPGSSGDFYDCSIEYADKDENSAGISLDNASVTIDDCTFYHNQSGLIAKNITNFSLTDANTFDSNLGNALYVSNCTNTTISHQTFTDNGGVAMYMHNTGEFDIGAGITSTNNDWTLVMDDCSYPSASSAGYIPITGNTNSDGIYWKTSLITDNMYLYDMGYPYIATGSHTIASGGNLEIEDNVHILFENNSQITNEAGLFDALGTASHGILFSRRTASDSWKGLRFESSNEPTINYCTIEYANSPDAVGIYAENVMPACSHCVFQHNTVGVKVLNKSNHNFYGENTFSDNEDAIIFSGCDNVGFAEETFSNNTNAVKLYNCENFLFSNNLTFSNNTWGISIDFSSSIDSSSMQNIDISSDTNSDGIKVLDSEISSNLTWNYQGLAYIIPTNITLVSGSNFSLGEGIHFLFEDNTGFTINGNLNINGVSGNPVRFTLRNSTNYWNGIIYSSSSGGNINYLQIDHAYGGANNYGFQVYSSAVSLSNVTSEYNSKGLYIEGVDNFNLNTTNHFDNNINGIWAKDCDHINIDYQVVTDNLGSKGGIVLESCEDFTIGSHNTITGNYWAISMDVASYPNLATAGHIPNSGNTYNDGLYVFAGNLTNNTTWGDILCPYIIGQSITIPVSTALTIDPAVELEFWQNTVMQIEGNLFAQGTVSDSIYFKGAQNFNWSGLLFEQGSGTILHCKIEDASYSTISVGIQAHNSSNLNIQNTLITGNYCGISIYGTMPNISNCTIKNNIIGGEISNVDNATIPSGNTITNNTQNGLKFTYCDNITLQPQNFINDNYALVLKESKNFKFQPTSVFSNNIWGISIDFTSSIDTLSNGNIDISGDVNSDGIYVDCNSEAKGSWDFNGLPYIVTSDIVFNANAQSNTFSFGKGVHLLFENNTGLKTYSSISTNGTANEPVVFSRRTSLDNWNGIVIYAVSGNCPWNFNHLTVEYAANQTDSGIYIYDSDALLSGVISRYNSKGLYLNGLANYNLTSPNTFTQNTDGIVTENCANLTIKNQTVTNNTSSNYGGIYLKNCDNFIIGTGNTITGNNWGVIMDFLSYPNAASSGNIPNSGNTNNGLYVYGGNGGWDPYLSESTTWPNLQAPYVIGRSFLVEQNKIFTIEAGSELLFAQWTKMTIDGGSKLIAEGTVSDSITFSNWQTNQMWGGLYFLYGKGNLSHCKIENANSTGIFANVCDSINVQNSLFKDNHIGLKVSSGTMPILNNNRFIDNNYNNNWGDESGIYIENINPVSISGNNFFLGNGYGLYLTGCDNIDVSGITLEDNLFAGIKFNSCSSPISVNNSNFTRNQGYGAFYFQNSGDFTLNCNSTFALNAYPLTVSQNSYPSINSDIPTTGNIKNRIRLINHSSGYYNGTYHNFSIPYQITETMYIGTSNSLTFAAGDSVYVNENTGITVAGSLNLNGTSSNPITFTKAESNLWNGIAISYSGAVANISYATIEYANKGISNDNSDDVTISNCTIQNNTTGVYLYNGKVRLQAQNNILNNTQYGLYAQTDSYMGYDSTFVFGSNSMSWNQVYGNGYYDVYNQSGMDMTASYVYWGTSDTTQIAQHIFDKNDESWRGTVNFANYLTTEPGGFPAPSNVQISVSGNTVTLTWDAVSGATSYKVYSSDNPTSGFTEDTSGTFNGESWSRAISGNEKRFYYVKARN